MFRDAALFKVAYGFGLRRTEAQMLDLADLGTNPHAAEFGEYGLCRVRLGKAGKGSPPKRRSVLTVWPWLPGVLGQWIEEARPLMATAADSAALWPSERGHRVGVSALNKRFNQARDALGLAAGLDFHSLRRSYVTHLLEDGWDPLFVQHQVGPRVRLPTTALYSCVSSDFRTRTLRRAMDATMTAAMTPGKGDPDAMMTAARQVSYQVAAAGSHGRPRAVQRHRPGPVARRTRHPPVLGAGLAAGHPDPRAAVPARPRGPSATSLRSPLTS